MLITEDLIALIELSEAQNLKASAMAANGDAQEVAGGVMAFCGDGNPWTQVAAVGLSREVSDEEFSTILDFYKGRATKFEFKLSPLTTIDLREKVVRAAQSLPEFESLLVCELTQYEPQNETVDIRRVDPSDAFAYATRAASRFHAGSQPPPGLIEGISQAAFRKGVLSFEIWLDDRPVAGCGLCIGNEVAWLAGAATMPEYRNRGLHKAMQHFRMRTAKELGCKVIVQGALPGSQSQVNAQKCGFQVAFTRPTFYL